MNSPLSRDCESALRYDRVVATGGIGSGMLFLLEGNETLGRNESRLGELTPARDFAKQHIILHYVAKLLGAGRNNGLVVHPISCVGNDEVGKRLLTELREVGMETSGIQGLDGAATLFSVCFQYPDSSGGNITTSNGACSHLTPDDIHAEAQGLNLTPRDIILAAPEVPVGTRTALLREGKKHGSFTIASVLATEVEDFVRGGGIEITDLLAVNLDEARALIGCDAPDTPAGEVVRACMQYVQSLNPAIILSVTDGPYGSFGCKGHYVEYVPSLPTDVLSSAGAGDAYLSGIIIALCCGLPLFKERTDGRFGETPLCSGLELGTTLASLALTSIDSIHLGIDAKSLMNYLRARELDATELFAQMLLAMESAAKETSDNGI